MFGLGTIVNTIAIIVSGWLGTRFARFIKASYQESVLVAAGVALFFLSTSGAMAGLLSIHNGQLMSGQTYLTIFCLCMGTLIGEVLNIERSILALGDWLRSKSGNSGDPLFMEAFVTATLTVCIGAMAVVGSIQDGLLGDATTLITKSVLDFIIILIMASSLGKGCTYAAVPVFLFQGSLTLLAGFLRPFMTPLAIANLSLIGSMLIFCICLNLLFDRKIRVANMLPALLLAVVAAFI